MNLEQKQEILLKWKQSGLSLPKWWKENVDELGLPHLSTLYAWAKQLGFSTEPGAEVTNEHYEEEHEEHDEMGDSDESQEEDDKGPQDGSQGSAKKEIDDEKENDDAPEEDVIAKDRIEQLAPVTVPEPAHAEEPVEEPKAAINTQTLVIIGGAVIFGIGAFLLIRKIRKRPEPKQEQNTQGGNPFGYITIDEF